MELSERLVPFEVAGQTEEREYFPLKARQLAADWEVRQRKTKLEKHATRRLRILHTCEGYCRELRQVLRGCTKSLVRPNAIDELLRPVRLFRSQTASISTHLALRIGPRS